MVDAEGLPCYIPNLNSGGHQSHIKKMAIGHKVKAYPVDIPLPTLCKKPDILQPKTLPKLSLRPRIIGRQKSLENVPVLFEGHQISELVHMNNELTERGLDTSPWYISLYKESQIAFTVEGIGVILEPIPTEQVFRFVKTVLDYKLDEASVFLKVDLEFLTSTKGTNRKSANAV